MLKLGIYNISFDSSWFLIILSNDVNFCFLIYNIQLDSILKQMFKQNIVFKNDNELESEFKRIPIILL